MSERPGEDAPVFVVGAPRSGTSLMRLILNAHSNLASPFETEFFIRLNREWGDGDPALWHKAVATFIERCRRELSPEIELQSVERQLLAGSPDYSRLLSAPLQHWAQSQGKRRWAEKTPTHIFYGRAIRSLFPTAKVIVMKRDPRAVVESLNRTFFAPADSAINARLWCDCWTSGIGTLVASLSPQRVHIVSYEELVARPEAVLRGVCAFVGEEFEVNMLSYHETSDLYAPRRLLTSKLSAPIQRDTEDWREKLTPRQIALVEEVCRPAMEAAGYATTISSVPTFVRAEAALKMLYVQTKQWQNSGQTYHKVSYRPFERWRRQRQQPPRLVSDTLAAGRDTAAAS